MSEAQVDPVLAALLLELEQARQKAMAETGGAVQAACITMTKADLLRRFDAEARIAAAAAVEPEDRQPPPTSIH
jgi:hypothetical protein